MTEKQLQEKSRYTFDSEYRAKYNIICGIDEAGRGPLAGDVYAAAVILDPKNPIAGINDSKKISEKKRELLFDEIMSRAAAVSIGISTVDEIESMNILNAAMLAMKRAADGLEIKPDFALIDGNRIPSGLDMAAECVIKGDSFSASIGAASIIAKVSRDNYIKELAKKYPCYGFDKHKGYGTKAHREAILKYGPCPIHRKSFLKKICAE